jgi:hypothetical protein
VIQVLAGVDYRLTDRLNVSLNWKWRRFGGFGGGFRGGGFGGGGFGGGGFGGGGFGGGGFGR